MIRNATKNRKLHLAARLLLTAYLVFVVVHALPHGLLLPGLAHEIAGACTGDCRTCGCSLESRIANTCCCAQKAARQRSTAAAAAPGCGSGARQCSPSGDRCCINPRMMGAAIAAVSSLAREMAQDEQLARFGATDTAAPAPVLKCGCPCGSQPDAAFPAISSEILPAAGWGVVVTALVSTPSLSVVDPFRSRCGTPPDPPPKLSSCRS
jgi:hypothetical protein